MEDEAEVIAFCLDFVDFGLGFRMGDMRRS
jgi:hypothetical protein